MEKISVSKLSDKQIKSRLKKWFNMATSKQVKEGLLWYPNARWFVQTMSDRFGVSQYRVASCLAALSPRNKWKRNLIDCYSVLSAWEKGKSPSTVRVCTFDKNKQKAFDALNGKMISESSRKTHSFALNVSDLGEVVTVDSWHIRASSLLPSQVGRCVVDTVTPKQYNRIERLTLELASKFDLKGFEFQAIVWLVIKNAFNR
jgi:hypothetical protein